MTKGKPRAATNDQKFLMTTRDDRHCMETLKDGSRCGAYHLDGKLLCAMHDPETKAAIMQDKTNYQNHAAWLKNELEKPHDLTSAKGIVQFGNLLIQAVLHKQIKRPEANTMGYLIGTQLQAIRSAREEEKPEQNIRDLIGDSMSVTVQMTREERIAFLTAGSASKMGQIMAHVAEDGRVIDTTKNEDGSYSAKVTASPRPSRDMKVPVKAIAEAMKDEGFDVTNGEVEEWFGEYAGDEKESNPELIGLTEVFEPGAMPPSLYHEFTHKQVPHERLEGCLKSVYVCNFCGISVANTSRWETLFCEKRLPGANQS